MSVWCGNVRQHIPSHQMEERNIEVRHAFAPPVPSLCCIIHVDWNGTLCAWLTVCEKTSPLLKPCATWTRVCTCMMLCVLPDLSIRPSVLELFMYGSIQIPTQCFYDVYWNDPIIQLVDAKKIYSLKNYSLKYCTFFIWEAIWECQVSDTAEEFWETKTEIGIICEILPPQFRGSFLPCKEFSQTATNIW